jgi:hypothetical protein
MDKRQAMCSRSRSRILWRKLSLARKRLIFLSTRGGHTLRFLRYRVSRYEPHLVHADAHEKRRDITDVSQPTRGRRRETCQ